jgi:thioredoxin reductase (NADPH)
MAAFDYDVVVVGGGPAGLTAGLHLGRAGRRAVILEREMFGGNLQHTGRIEDHPEFPEGITGAQLAARMIESATACGATFEQAEVSGIELFSRSRWVACSDGRGFSCGVVILAGGTHYTKLGLSNEDRFRGRGVVDCTPCDGGFFVDRDVVVYGSTDHAVSDAVYLGDLGARVTLLAPEPDLHAGEPLHARVASHPAIRIRQGLRLKAILGDDRLEGLVCTDAATGAEEQIAAQGLLVRVGSRPSSEVLADVVDLDEAGHVVTNTRFETSAGFVLACGDIRSGTEQRIVAAVGEGAGAAERALELLASID